MKLGVIFTVIFTIIALAYSTANQTLSKKVNLSSLKLQMTIQEVEQNFGSPFSRQRNVLTYVLEDSSQLMITLRDDVVASAIIKFHHPRRIEDPEMRRMTLVQMSPADIQNENPSWFYAGKPEEGLIYKITQNGTIESMTWVPPFTYANHQAKNLQALVQDFNNQQLSNL